MIVMGSGRRPVGLFRPMPEPQPPATEAELAAKWEQIRAAEAQAEDGDDHEDPVTQTP